MECSKNDEIAPKARENFGNFENYPFIFGNFDAFPWKFLFGNSEIVLEIIFGNSENEKKRYVSRGTGRMPFRNPVLQKLLNEIANGKELEWPVGTAVQLELKLRAVGRSWPAFVMSCMQRDASRRCARGRDTPDRAAPGASPSTTPCYTSS